MSLETNYNRRAELTAWDLAFPRAGKVLLEKMPVTLDTPEAIQGAIKAVAKKWQVAKFEEKTALSFYEFAR